jgi:1,4-alpha-glucan branching enzyme
MSNPIGVFTFVLHSHIPYVRLAGRWPHGEEWIHEAAVGSYLPLLRTLYDLKSEGIAFRLTISLTPVLVEQLADPDICDHLEAYLGEKIAAAQRDQIIFADSIAADDELMLRRLGMRHSPDPHLHHLAGWYADHYRQIRSAYLERFHRDIVGAFRVLQDEGFIEISTSAATHGYLPLLAEDGSIRGQIATAIASYERHFGRRPRTMWLPECAYRPAYYTEDGALRAGLETFLREAGIQLFFSETHAIIGGQPVGVSAGDVIGPYGEIVRRYVVPTGEYEPRRSASTYQPYWVSETSDPASGEHAGVAVIGRNNSTGQQVWSADWGYPGDFDYCEFHKKAGTSGLHYWRVTGEQVDLGHKEYYQPDWASFKVEQHAEHFAHLVTDLLRDYHNRTGQIGILASNYDTELFGHWWFEGVNWLGQVIRYICSDENIDMAIASDFVAANPPSERIALPESSWGTAGGHFTWNNGQTFWMWEPIHAAERTMRDLVNRFPSATDAERVVLNQAARELLLLQSSDWPFLVTTGQAREYAIQRFSQHVERFNQLADSLNRGQANPTLAATFWERDKIFPDIDYRSFA